MQTGRNRTLVLNDNLFVTFAPTCCVDAFFTFCPITAPRILSCQVIAAHSTKYCIELDPINMTNAICSEDCL